MMGYFEVSDEERELVVFTQGSDETQFKANSTLLVMVKRTITLRYNSALLG